MFIQAWLTGAEAKSTNDITLERQGYSDHMSSYGDAWAISIYQLF